MTDILVEAHVRIAQAPQWARLQRVLFDLLDTGWRRFEQLCCGPDGSLLHQAEMRGRGGVDQHYEPFFNWPVLYLLGGADDLLDACKRHWEGVTAALTARGMLTEEFENGYDWLHQGRSLLFFYGICVADPDDEAYRRRALRFADMYLPDSLLGNYDPDLRMMRAPHVGALGPNPGLGETVFPSSNDAMRRYGLPLRDIPGIAGWRDLRAPHKARKMAGEMNRRLGVGDVPLNLAVTSLVANAWLYDHDQRYADFITNYVEAWSDRARGNGGLIPDNVGPSGVVGQMHDGRWYGGHYGWAWPYGLSCVVPAALIGAMNAFVVSGEHGFMELPRQALRILLARARWSAMDPSDASGYDQWRDRLDTDAERELLLVPHRRNAAGWFDYQPLPPAYPTWLWWQTRDPADLAVLADLKRTSGYSWRRVREFRDREEGGHEAPWLTFLAGRNPRYPEEALSMAIALTRQRIQQMAAGPSDGCQGLNPVVTEVLTQLIAGAPQMLHHGGLPYHQLRWTDAIRSRPGLPAGVAALVEYIDGTSVTVQILNLDHRESRTVELTGGTYGERPISGVTDLSTGGRASEDGPVRPAPGRLRVHLSPRTRIRLRLHTDRNGAVPRHQRSIGSGHPRE
jgi:hypothetical protein